MKQGHDHHVYVNPTDEMSCVDICKLSNVYVPGMSMAKVVSLTLGGLIESARAAELIPRRDGFEYNEIVGPLLGAGRNKKKLQITEVFKLAEVSRVANDIPASVVSIPKAPAFSDPVRMRKVKRLGSRIDELNMKRDVNPLNFSEEDQAELYKLVDELNAP